MTDTRTGAAFRGLWLRLLVLVLAAMALELATAQSGLEILDQTAQYRLVRHLGGETRVPAQPPRVVSLNATHTDSLVSLGVRPAGIGTFTGADFSSYDYLEDELRGVPIVGTLVEPNLEAVLAVGPDLILLPDDLLERAGQLELIAPTVVLPDTNGDFRAALVQVAQVLGLENEAQARLERFETFAATARARLDEAVGGESVAFLRVRPRDLRLYGNARLVGPILYGDLGLTPPPLVRELAVDQNYASISLETIPRLGADHLFVLSQDEERYGELQASPLWRNVPAVAQGHVYSAERDVWINTGVLAAEAVIERVLAALTDQR